MSTSRQAAEPDQNSSLEETKAYLEELSNGRVPILIRRLISFWGYNARGKNVVAVLQHDLTKMGLTTVPPFDSGPLDSVVVIEKLTQDIGEVPEPHLLTLSRIASANSAIRNADDRIPLGYAVRSEPIDAAVTTMLRHDYSQLPVVQSESDRNVVGVISWETYARARLRGENPKSVEAAMEPVATVDLHSDLFASVGPIAKDGFVIVSYLGQLSGIVTASDLTTQFQQLAVPFLAVGRCEQELKRVAKLYFPEPVGRPIDRFQFGQLQDLYKKHWDLLGWSLSNADFIKWLDTTRNLRNSIAHFDNQDVDRTTEVEDVHRLTEWLRLVSPDKGEELAGKKPE